MLTLVNKCKSPARCICSLLFFIVTLCAATAGASSIEELFRASAGNEEFSAPSVIEREQARELFGLTLSGAAPFAQLKKRWDALHFDLVEIEDSGKTYRALKEQSGYRSGRGFYLFRKNSAGTTLLQLPHRFKDEMTGEIGFDMMQSGTVRVAAWNTVPRWRTHNGVTIEQDLAHRDDTYFTALTAAFAELYPEGKVVQLHGFDAGKRKNPEARTADVIISSGSHTVSRRVRKTAVCLRSGGTSKKNVLIFPEDVRELGATTNVTGRQLAQLTRKRTPDFIHIEMSHDYRMQLLKDAGERSRLAECVERAQ